MSGLADVEVIRSSTNSTLKRLRSLHQRSGRYTERAFVVEGRRAVEDAIDAGGRAHAFLIREDAEWHPPVGNEHVPIKRVETRLFNAAAETESPQPVIAIFELPSIQLLDDAMPLFLVVDGVRDPGNLGTLLRSAAAAGATAIVTTPGTVDPFNGKVVRAGMGAHFRMPILALDESIRALLEFRCTVRALAEPHAALRYDRVSWQQGAALIVGSEAHGPSQAGRDLATCSVSIPLENGVESLNAGVAGSILMFEAARQRRI